MNKLSFKIASNYQNILNLSFRSLGSTSSSKFSKNLNSNLLKNQINLLNSLECVCNFGLSSPFGGTAAHAETTSTTQGLNKLQAQELVLRLNTEERTVLYSALQEYQSKLVKDEYQGQLAASRWRSKYGRPAKLPKLGDVDPTGSYCALPEDWLMKKSAESVPVPSMNELINIAVANSIPFIGFGFLDNFFMILFGDYIDWYLGSYFCMSTMAAAALGNTFSDVLGIGSAFYVERLANKIGYRPPKLSPIQMEMPISRQFANLGRVLGVTIGCLLGMFPLLFKSGGKKKEKIAEEKNEIIVTSK